MKLKMMKIPIKFNKLIVLFLIMALFSVKLVMGSYILIPMDNSQKNHLKAYGIAYWILKRDVDVSWLLNYRGGSFMIKYDKSLFKNFDILKFNFKTMVFHKLNLTKKSKEKNGES